MAINDDSFMDTHCDVCGGLNHDDNYTCDECLNKDDVISEVSE